jgi:hypothetical protein
MGDAYSKEVTSKLLSSVFISEKPMLDTISD